MFLLTFVECSGRDLPCIVIWYDDRCIVFEGGGKTGQLGCDSFVRIAFGNEGRKVGVPLERDAEILFEGNELVELASGDAGCAGELVLVAEDTEFAGTTSEAHEVTGVWPDAVFLQEVPDLLFLPVTDGAEPVDVAEGVLAAAEVSLVRFQDGIACSLFALFSAFAGEYQRANVLEPRVMPERCGADVDLQIGRTPAHAEVRGWLREAASGGRLATGPAGLDFCPIRELKVDWGREAVVSEHLPRKAAFFPLKEDGDTEGIAELAAVVRSHLPVEEAWAAPVYLLVPELDFLFRDTVVKEIEEAGRGVLSAGEGNDVFIVVEKVKVHFLHFDCNTCRKANVRDWSIHLHIHLEHLMSS